MKKYKGQKLLTYKDQQVLLYGTNDILFDGSDDELEKFQAMGIQDIEAYRKAFGLNPPTVQDAICHVENRHDTLKCWAKEAVEAVGMEGFVTGIRFMSALEALKLKLWESKIDEFIYCKRAQNGDPHLVSGIKSNYKKEQDLITAEIVTYVLKHGTQNHHNEISLGDSNILGLG